MIIKTEQKKEYHSNGTLWINQIIAYISPLAYHLYPQRLVNSKGEYFIKLKYEKWFDNGQFAWKLEWSEKGELINKNDHQYRKDGTIIQY